jgi:hypothetical protein
LSIDRYTEIERENRILLEKMTHIMHNANVNRVTMYSGTGSTLAANSVASTTVLNKRSLNREARKRELLKITMEN